MPAHPAAADPLAPGTQVLHGRESELEILQGALQQVRRLPLQVIWLSGEAGVGKTALVEALRQPVRRAEGHVVWGWCEPFGAAEVLQAPRQALRQLLRQLGQQPPSSLQPLGPTLREALGSDAAALLPLLPELQQLTGELPTPSDLEAYEVPQRLISLLLVLIRQLARQATPLVLVLDDLHWADPLSLELLDALLEAPDLHGLLLIGLFRRTDLQLDGPLGQLLQRGAAAPTPPLELELANLGQEQVAALLGELLTTDPDRLNGLSEVVLRSTSGNPFFVIQLLRSLQRQSLLRPDPVGLGWHWDQALLAQRLRSTDVVAFLSEDLHQLAPPCRELLQTLACLGSQANLRLLGQASGLEPAELAIQLQQPLRHGVLVCREPTALQRQDPSAVVGFGHDRLQQSVVVLSQGSDRLALHLAIARRLLAADQRLLAAEHYAVAISQLDEPRERRQVCTLLQEAGRTALAAGGVEAADHLLQQAWSLLGPEPWLRDPELAWELQVALHQLAYGRADYVRTDRLHTVLENRASSPQQLLDPTAIQVMALSNRGQYQAAVDLAARLLCRLGLQIPQQQTLASLELELQAFERLVQAGALTRLPPLPARTPAGGSIAKLMNRLVPGAFFCNPPLACWLVLHSTQQWLAGDAQPARLYPLACTLLATASWRQDYATGYTTARIALAAGEAGDHGVETARTRHVFSLFCLHWFEPLEQGLLQARRAHQELRRCGEQEFACYTFYSSQAALLDCGASLHDLAEENSRALAFARRSGNRHAQPAYAAYSALIAALTGVEEAGASPDEPEAAERLEQANPMAACYVHLCRALAACLLHDNPALQRHAEAASRLELYITGFYPAALIRLLQAFALIRQHGDQLESCQSDHLDQLQAWFVARAADAPQNFAHLADLIAAERLRASGQTHDALPLYERAMRTAIAHQRPWHAALAAECAARCYLALGLEQAGLHLMEQAHQRYGDWGAGRVTTALEQEFPVLRGNKLLANDVHRLLGASQSLARLRTLPALAQATAQLVGDLSGATDVQIVGLDGEQTWKLLAGFSPQGELRRQSLEQAERRDLLPASALRLSLQQLQPLVCHDAVLDPRFTADSHLDDLSCCSLLVVPVVVQQRPIAAVIAMYRLKRGAFGPDLARSVELLCGHLAVALENLLIQQSLEQQVQERSQALVQAYDREARREQQRRQQLEQKLKTSLTAAAVVHEVQQPLAAILLNCRLALQSLEALPAGAIPPSTVSWRVNCANSPSMAIR